MMPTRAYSYVSGTSSIPLIGETIGRQLNQAAMRWPEREALVVRHQQIRWSYAELLQRVDGFAAGLIALGMEPGDRVGIWSPNCAEWIVTQYATAKVGLILVNINPAYRVTELEYALQKVKCKALICAESFKSSDYTAMITELAPEVSRADAKQLNLSRLPALKILIHTGRRLISGFHAFEEVATLASTSETKTLEQISSSLQFDDPINIQFTSGTTGAPKGATLTHHSILNNGFLVGEALRFTERDRLCIPVPLYHCFGMVMGSLCCITHGMTMVFPSPAFDAKATLDAIQAERCTALYGVPTMFVAMLAMESFKSYDFASLRTGIMSGAPCPVDVMRRVVHEMNMREITIAYGMTETSPVSTLTSVDDDEEVRVSTVGTALPHTEVKIIDPTGRIVRAGEPGELCSRGYLVMRGYWADEERTAEVIDRAGWMHTGDIATMDPDGYCNIVGRMKDMVIRGGENIYPREIEDYFHRHPQVEDAYVFGVPDPVYGEELCVWIKLRSGEQSTDVEIKKHFSGRISHQKIPRYIHFVSEFPTTVTGKVQKYVMREAMVRMLNEIRQAQSEIL
jgi:fatty-acyl-CoA synthase